jgi:hypothetical protein
MSRRLKTVGARVDCLTDFRKCQDHLNNRIQLLSEYQTGPGLSEQFVSESQMVQKSNAIQKPNKYVQFLNGYNHLISSLVSE